MKSVLPPDSVTETESEPDAEMEEPTQVETKVSTPKKVEVPVVVEEQQKVLADLQAQPQQKMEIVFDLS